MLFDKCIKDALRKLDPQSFGRQKNSELHISECEIYAWPQMWTDTGCGFGKVAGQAITTATTLVVVGPMRDACVYHNGKFAYKVVQTNEAFWAGVDKRNLPSESEFEVQNASISR